MKAIALALTLALSSAALLAATPGQIGGVQTTIVTNNPDVKAYVTNLYVVTTCTNLVTISTNTHTAGQVIGNFILTNFFQVNGGEGVIETVSYSVYGQTVSNPKVFWFFSRPISDTTNNAAWTPSTNDLMFLCSRIDHDSYSSQAIGAVAFHDHAVNLSRTVKNTWTNKNLYCVITQGGVITAGATSNATDVARTRVSGWSR